MCHQLRARTPQIARGYPARVQGTRLRILIPAAALNAGAPHDVGHLLPAARRPPGAERERRRVGGHHGAAAAYRAVQVTAHRGGRAGGQWGRGASARAPSKAGMPQLPATAMSVWMRRARMPRCADAATCAHATQAPRGAALARLRAPQPRAPVRLPRDVIALAARRQPAHLPWRRASPAPPPLSFAVFLVPRARGVAAHVRMPCAYRSLACA